MQMRALKIRYFLGSSRHATCFQTVGDSKIRYGKPVLVLLLAEMIIYKKYRDEVLSVQFSILNIGPTGDPHQNGSLR